MLFPFSLVGEDSAFGLVLVTSEQAKQYYAELDERSDTVHRIFWPRGSSGTASPRTRLV